MPNLLPQKEKEVLYSIYKRKMIILGLIALSLLLIVASLLLLPSYLLSVSKLNSAKEDLKVLKESVIYREGRNTEQELVETEQRLNLVSPIMENNRIEEEVLNLLKSSPAEVSISALTFKKVDGSNYQISLIGTAKTRDSLIQYKENLQRNSAFKNVDLPVSNLAKDTNLNFNIIINL